MTRKPPTDVKATFERIGPPGAAERYVLRLYVTGMTPRSTRAIKNLRAICDEHLEGRYDLEVVDIYQQPAADEGRADHRGADAHQAPSAADAQDHRRHVTPRPCPARTRSHSSVKTVAR